MAMCLAATGCKMFGKKSNASTSNPAPAGQYTPAERAVADRTAPPQGVNGIIAGQVIDSFNRKPPPTVIQVVSLDAKDPNAAPITVKLDPVNADTNGYFTIQNLQPGRQYQLIARAEDGTKKLAGVTWATPPNPRVTIRISEDFAGKDITEGAPPKRRAGNNQRTPPKPDERSKDPAAYIGTPIAPESQGASENGTPIPLGGSVAPTGANGNNSGSLPPIETSHPENLSKDNVASIIRPPVAEMNGLRPPREQPPREGTPLVALTGSAPVPSCSLTGRTLYNFALNDIEGKPWEFRKDRKGRLVLIDFWGTWCIPCQHAIPHLKDLQWRYGQFGLEVVGVAYEHGTPAQQVQNVKRVAARLQTNYRLLLGSGYDSDCPVRKQFEVRTYPSLFLLDEKGQIVWQSREGLGPRELQELEFEIQRRLNVH
jgi:thiol-disulfide isomerase/thioredoxin